MTDAADMPDPPDNQSDAGSAASQDYDYHNIEWDEGEPLEEWHFTHRRAYILQTELLEKGNPDLVNWAELARRFGKSKSTLHRDKEKLLDYLATDVDDKRLDALGQAIFQKALREAVTETTYEKMAADGSIVEITEPPDYEAAIHIWRLYMESLARRGLTEWNDPEDMADEFGDVEGGLREVAVEIAGVAPEEVEDLPEEDPPELLEQEAET